MSRIRCSRSLSIDWWFVDYDSVVVMAFLDLALWLIVECWLLGGHLSYHPFRWIGCAE